MKKIPNKDAQQFALAELAEPSLEWIQTFEKEKENINSSIGQYIEHIEHMGSTAIPNIKAKPEIDILIGVEDIDKATGEVVATLKQINYDYFPKFEEFVPERRYFRKSAEDGITPLVHIHMVETSSQFYKDHILFRDWLRAHPEDAKRYEKLKGDLIEEFNGERDAYTKGKETFIKEILEKAKNEN